MAKSRYASKASVKKARLNMERLGSPNEMFLRPLGIRDFGIVPTHETQIFFTSILQASFPLLLCLLSSFKSGFDLTPL
jgi:hypothetical protein